MAGLGRKVFASGDILLASEVQGFLQDQAVMVFDDDAARTAAIATPTEGMVTFRKDDNALEVFDGSVFAPIGSSPGLQHINSTSFSAVSAISLSDDTFTTVFDDYKIMLTINNFATGGTTVARMRAGSDNNTGSYANGVFEVRTNNTSAIFAANLGQSSWILNSSGTTSGENPQSYSFDLFSPKLAEKTKLMGFSTGITTDNTQFRFFYHGQLFNGNTVFDSMTFIFPGSSSGRLSVYGYAK